MTNGPVIVWLEDRDTTISQHQRIASDNGIDYYIFATPKEFMSFLEELHADIESGTMLRVGLVIDIMLFSVLDLKEFGIEDASTRKGIHAGYVFADRILRETKSAFRNYPICFLTERDIDSSLSEDVERIRKKGDGKVSIVQKFFDNELPKFIEFISEI